MRLDLRSIVGIARSVGWPADQEAETAALAYATSGGDTRYRHRPGIPGAGDTRGLWGIDVDRWPWLAGYDLYDPETNAAAALSLTRAAGHLGWSPVAHTGAHQHWIARAGTHRTRNDLAPRVAARSLPPAGIRHVGAALTALRRFGT